MTRFARPDVYQCPECSGHFLWAGLMSFNNFGITTSWSDGQTAMGGIIDAASVRSCPTCHAVLWLDDLQALGVSPREPRPQCWLGRIVAGWTGDKHGYLRDERAWANVAKEWKAAAHASRPTYSSLQQAACASGIPSDREIFLRRRIWWATNDHHRLRDDGQLVAEVAVASEEERRANIMRLIALHGVAGNAVAERAELWRNLGEFDRAVALLTSADAKIRTSRAGAYTLQLARKRIAEVMTM